MGKSILNYFDDLIKKAVWVLCYFIPINKNKIVVCSYFGRGFSDNPKAIVNELIKRQCGYKIVWLVKKGENLEDFPRDVTIKRYDSLQYIYQLATAKMWIDNSRKYFVYKKKKQVYLQTWHGYGPKKFEKDVADKLSPEYVKIAIRDSKHCDLLLSNCGNLTDLYKRAFWYNGPIMEEGFPRNDIFFSDYSDIAVKVKDSLGIPRDKKILLYAPTFRVDYSLSSYILNYQDCLAALCKKFGGDWVVLYRLHPNIFKLSRNLKFDSTQSFNGSFYEDAQEILIASNACISDYSSLMFDFALLKRPGFLFTPDVKDYKKDRNFYIDISRLPFPQAYSNKEMIKNITGFNMEKYSSDISKFLVEHRYNETGHASQKVADWIEQKMKRGN